MDAELDDFFSDLAAVERNGAEEGPSAEQNIQHPSNASQGKNTAQVIIAKPHLASVISSNIATTTVPSSASLPTTVPASMVVSNNSTKQQETALYKANHMGMTHSEAQQIASQQSTYNYAEQQRMAALASKYGISKDGAQGSSSNGGDNSGSNCNNPSTNGEFDSGGAGKKRSHTRMGADGSVWVDKTLDDWPENDWRLFAGDLGNEVTDDLLSRAFSKYASFAKAKIVRDKVSYLAPSHSKTIIYSRWLCLMKQFTGKTKGYGFVSFIDPFDAAKALREMNGKYVG